MEKPWLMGIDLGGSGARCLLVNRDSKAQVSAAGSWQFSPVPGTFGTGFDIDLDQVWTVIGSACREAVQRAGIASGSVGAVAVSAMRFSTVLLDDKGDCLFAAPNRDARAAGEYFDIAGRLGPALLAATGSPPLPLHASARLLWLQQQQPDIFNQVRTVFGVGEWLNYRLSGVRAIDATLGSATGLFSLTQREWCWSLIDELGLPREIFPPVIDAGEAIGALSASAASHLGLDPGVLVGMGGADTQCSLLGSGVLEPGACAVVAGTTAPVQVVLQQPVIDPDGKSLGTHHIAPGRWILESNGGPMGDAITLMANMLFPETPEPELRLLAEAALSEPGAAGMLSTVGAQVMNMQSPAIPMGHITMSPMYVGGESRRHLVRALVEGCCCAVRANVEQLDTVLRASGLAATNPASMILCGGLSCSDVFPRLLANIIARHIEVPATDQTAALGAAMCAGVAAGDFADFSSASAALCDVRLQLQPETGPAETNRQLYDTWCRFRDQAEATTAPIAVDHLLPRMLQDTAVEPAAGAPSPPGLKALVSASFDEHSLTRLSEKVEVEYASFREVRRLLTGPRLVEALQGKQIFVTEVDVLDASTLSQLPDLRVVAACRGNAVNVDIEACSAFGIPVLFAPGRNAVAVADLTVGFMINLARKLPTATRFLQEEECTAGNMGKMGQAFKQLQGRELWHKTIGLVGLGAVGRAVARRLAGFEVEILVSDPFITPEQAALSGCRLTDLDTLLRCSDFVSLHAAVTPATTGMIGVDEFAKMQPHAFFINTARAALIDEQALVNALTHGAIAGAALDTFAVEPPGFDHPLVQHPQVICTPHSAGNTVEVASHQGESIASALLQLLRGESPECVLNPETLVDFHWNKPQLQPSAAELERLSSSNGPAVTDLQRDAPANSARPESQHSPAVTAPPTAIGKMKNLLTEFCLGMAADPKLNTFSANQNVTLQFAIQDMGLNFYLSLQEGRVTSALGAPTEHAEVQLQMHGRIIDGMFTGTVNTMECAMNGDISFTGDAAKAMTLQEIDTDMERIYTAARAKLGDPFV